jgi:hypothetical protein
MAKGMPPNPCRIRGVLYPSQKAAAAAIGVTAGTVSGALATGKEDTVGLRLSLRRPLLVAGVLYQSRGEAADALGISRQSIYRYINSDGVFVGLRSKRNSQHRGIGDSHDSRG